MTADRQMQSLQDEILKRTIERNRATAAGDKTQADAIQRKINQLVAFYD